MAPDRELLSGRPFATSGAYPGLSTSHWSFGWASGATELGSGAIGADGPANVPANPSRRIRPHVDRKRGASGDTVDFERPPTLPRMSTGGRIVVRIGAGMLALGLLMVAFVVYQLWGTALYTEHAQAHLKSELSSE